MRMTRRAVLASGALSAAAALGGWAILADRRVVPGRRLIDDFLGRCEPAGMPPTEADPGPVISGSFYSSHRRRHVGYTIAYPPSTFLPSTQPPITHPTNTHPTSTYPTSAGDMPPPVCVVLHGLGSDHRGAIAEIGYHRLLAGAGVAPFVLASIDGGATYWHPRADGDDPLGMVLEDFPAVLEQHGLPAHRFAVLGWSMGGYGALLAALEAPERVVAAAAAAPAFWTSYDEARAANATAFATAEEWRRFGDLLPRAPELARLPIRVDCGQSDPFAPAVSLLADRLGDAHKVRLAPGCHDAAFWRSIAPDQLRFLGQAVTPNHP